MSIAEMNTSVAKYNLSDAAISAMAEEYLPLTIAGVDDTAGYKRVHEARMVVKAKRVEVEKTRKALNEDALAWQRKVNAEAKRITALLEPIESHLEQQQRAIDTEKQRIKDEARLKAEAEAREKAEAERQAEEARMKAIRDAEEARLRAEREKLAEEQRKLQAERLADEAQRKAEYAKLEAERRELEAKQRAEQEKMEAERRAIEAEKKRLADIEEERIRKEAAERARIETEQQIAREQAEAKAKAEAEDAARKRAEALKPDREKLLAVADAVNLIVVPSVSSDSSQYAERVSDAIDLCVMTIRGIVEGMK